MEEFLKCVQEKLNHDEALIIGMRGNKINRIVIAKKWTGIETPLGFTCVPGENKERYNEYIKGGIFWGTLNEVGKNPNEAELEIVKVFPEMIERKDLDEYRRIYSDSNK